MTRILLAGGLSAALMGATSILPVIFAGLERNGLSSLGILIISVGICLIVCGISAMWVGLRQRRPSGMPGGVRAAVAANILFLAFFALELSDRLIRQDGKIVYWSTFLFLPVLLLFCGLLAAQRWAWYTIRGLAALGTLWFLGFVAVIPFATLQADGVPTPWYGRVYMACVSLVFAGVLAYAFWSLGRPETRRYFV